MIRKEKNGVEWLEFELLSTIPGIVHGVFLRHGGVSPPPFNSLNVGGGTGDAPERVEENRRRIGEILGVKHMAAVHQVHGHEVLRIRGNEKELPAADGMITEEKGVGLLIKHADCQAAIFYDPVHRAVGNVHAGWRGNVQNIYRETVLKMNRDFGTVPRDLLVCISPSLGPEHAEFVHYKEEFPESFWKFQNTPCHFDLWQIARMQLEEEGVPPDHIQIASICTYAHAQDFFSYRREKTTGRNATAVALL